jgi:hypothetical protein
MAATWQELLAYFNGSLIGGEAIVRINKKHISLGKNRRGVFAWTPAGLELAQTVVIPRALPITSQSSPTVPVKRRPGRPPKLKVPVDAGPEN